MAEKESWGVDEITDSVMGRDEEDEETTPAEAFGLKMGLLAGIPAVYAFFVGPSRVMRLSSAAGDLLTISTEGTDPFYIMAAATLVVAFGAGLLFTLIADDLHDGYKEELAVNVLLPPSGVALFAMLLILLEPIAVRIIAGDLLEAGFILLVEAIGIAILVGSSIGIIALILVFGLYLGIPSYVGTFVGSLIGKVART